MVTIAAPSDPAHVAHLFKDDVAKIREQGEVEVQLAGRPFKIKRQLLEDVAEKRLHECLATLRKALLIFHSPTDEIVGIDNASHIFVAAKHPKSFVSLNGADHLLSKKGDAGYVADVIAAWAERYIERPVSVQEAQSEAGVVTVRETRAAKYQQEVMSGPHRFLADEPVAFGGLDSGPGPYDFLLASLGACTSMTLRIYADRKEIPLERVTVKLTHKKVHVEDCAECEGKGRTIDRIDAPLRLKVRSMPPAQAADGDRRKCPVHRTLRTVNEIRTFEQASEPV